MNCRYCYEQDKVSKYSEEEIVELCKNIAENNHDENFGIEFLGGEPCLAWNNILAAYYFFEQNYPNKVKDYVITTNGTILDVSMLDFFKKNPKIIYAVSIDGNKWANQFRILKGGTNAYELSIDNIKTALSVLGPEQVPIHMVTHRYNVGNVYDSIKLFYDIGIRAIGVGTIESTQTIDMSYCNRLIEEMDKVSQDIVNDSMKGLHVDILNNIKPKEDVRTYIKDKNGRVLGESYGRSANDLTHTDIYNSVQTDSPIGDMIYHLRRCIYLNHQERLKNEGTNC